MKTNCYTVKGYRILQTSAIRWLILLMALVASGLTGFSQSSDYAGAVIKKLASPHFKGRGYAGGGQRIAAQYISKEYQKIGLIPFKKNYYQKFEIAANIFPSKVMLSIDGKKLKPALDYIIDSSSPSVAGKFNVTTYHRNEITTDSRFQSIIDNAGDSFVLIDEGGDVSVDEETSAKIEDYINYLKYSRYISCKGVIIFTSKKLNFETSTFQNVRPVIYVHASMDVQSIHSVEVVIESEFRIFETRNIAGYIKGSEHPDSFLVVLAHYDHLGLMGSETYFPGANDNASGVAMLLTLARYYMQHQPSYTMVFISPSAEEIGLLGSIAFTEDPLFQLSMIKFLVNFDMAGTGSEGIRVINGSVFRDKFDILTRINSENQFLPKIDIRGEACNSDHCTFYKKGVPCFYIYTQGGLKAYHDIEDRAENFPLTNFENFSRLMIRFFDVL